MSLHDPDSTVREHAMALKVGRKKRVQIVNGQQVEYIGFEDEEEYEGEEDYVDEDETEENSMDEAELQDKKETIMAVGEDGQRYMVVEVINMEEDENSQIQLQDKDDNMEIGELYLEDEDPLQDKGHGDRDMTTCFGFVVSRIWNTHTSYYLQEIHIIDLLLVSFCRKKMALKMRKKYKNHQFNF